jgi:hypothetical protein
MLVGLARKSAANSNEKLVNQKYATLFLSWMPFRKGLAEKIKNLIGLYCVLGRIKPNP